MQSLIHQHCIQMLTHQVTYPQPQCVPKIEYIVSTVNQQAHLAEFPWMNSSLAVLVFKQGDDPIDAINKMMSFLEDQILMLPVLQEHELTLQEQEGIIQVNQGLSSVLTSQGEGHMARQCPKPKRKRDATWFKEKVLMVEAQGNGKVLNEEEFEFLADPGIAKGPVSQSVITQNAAYQVDDLDAYDYNCDKISIAKAVLMAN
ncbi:hypothetical protein Tco_0173920 [Tanacetum coccineum]